MKLHSSQTSPYVRKVLVVAHETGLIDRLDATLRVVSPMAPVEALNTDNPLGKVPALITDDGDTLFDSRVIVEYLDSLHDGPKFIPAAGPARWRALRDQALGDGILDAAILGLYERRVRPAEKQFDDWVDAQMEKVKRAVDALAAAPDRERALDIGGITSAIALSYLDFRYADLNWRQGRQALADWHAKIASRPSMQATMPPEGA